MIAEWLVNSLGRMVRLKRQCEDIEPGRGGILLSLRCNTQFGNPVPFATVAFRFEDLTDEYNVPLDDLEPWNPELAVSGSRMFRVT